MSLDLRDFEVIFLFFLFIYVVLLRVGFGVGGWELGEEGVERLRGWR